MHTVRQLGAALLLAIMGSAADAAATPVVPFVDCVDLDPDDGAMTAYFSYANNDTNPTTVSLGVNNFFSPAPSNRGQPSVFQAGVQRRVFQVTEASNVTLTWTLNGVAASASTGQPGIACFGDRIFPARLPGAAVGARRAPGRLRNAAARTSTDRRDPAAHGRGSRCGRR